MADHPTWVIVADGGGARFFIRRFPGVPLEELDELAETPNQLHHRHSHDDVGRGQQAILARVKPKEHNEHLFLRHVAGQIDRAVIENEVGRLALCAPPRALGALRNFLSDNARKLIASDIALDVLHEPVDRIDARMRAHRV